MALALHVRFQSFGEFKAVFDDFCSKGFHPMKILRSHRKGLEGEKRDRFAFKDIQYSCVHFGKDHESTSTGKRPVQIHNALDCKMCLRLVLVDVRDIDECYLEVRKLEASHNHPVSKELFACYPQNRRLGSDQLDFATSLLKVDVQPSKVKVLLKDKHEGKCVTSQDLRNVKSKLKAVQRGGRCEGKIVADTVTELLSNDAGSKVKIVSDDEGDILGVCFMTSRMQHMYAEYGQVLFIDATYKLNIEGFPLLVFLVEDGTTVGVPVMFGFVKHETVDILQHVLQWFVDTVDTSLTRVIMVDKDLTMLNLLQEMFRDCSVLLCRFHVLRYLRKKAQNLSKTSDEKSQLIGTIARLVYATSVDEYDQAYECLKTLKCDAYLSYFNENWHTCKELWCLAFRTDLLTLGNNTNNRLENFNRQLKRCLSSNLHLSEAILRLINGSYAVCSDVEYRHQREIGVRIDVRCRTLPELLGIALTNAAVGLVTSQYVKFVEIKTSTSVAGVGEDRFELQYNGKLYSISMKLCQCMCSFYCNYNLPCCHIFCARDSQGVQHCDEELINSIPKRWKKDAMSAALQSLPQGTYRARSKCGQHSSFEKVLHEQDRFAEARRVTASLCALLTVCGGAEFSQKLHQVSLLLSLWQQNKEVVILEAGSVDCGIDLDDIVLSDALVSDGLGTDAAGSKNSAAAFDGFGVRSDVSGDDGIGAGGVHVSGGVKGNGFGAGLHTGAAGGKNNATAGDSFGVTSDVTADDKSGAGGVHVSGGVKGNGLGTGSLRGNEDVAGDTDFLGRLHVTRVVSRKGRPKGRRQEFGSKKRKLEDKKGAVPARLSEKNTQRSDGSTSQNSKTDADMQMNGKIKSTDASMCKDGKKEFSQSATNKVRFDKGDLKNDNQCETSKGKAKECKRSEKTHVIVEDEDAEKIAEQTASNDGVIFLSKSKPPVDYRVPSTLPVCKYSIIDHEIARNDFFTFLHNGSQWLTSSHMNVAQELLKCQFPHVDGLQLVELFAPVEECRRIGTPSGRFVQIINVNYSHWICVSNLLNNVPGHITIYDSMAPSQLSPHLLRCLAWLLHYAGKEICVSWADVQRQRGGNDCGAFAIAFAIELCFGFNPSGRTFDQLTLRDDISSCFMTRKMRPLSSKQKPGIAFTIVKSQTYKVFCVCRQPWLKAESAKMAQCSQCKEWFHNDHMNIPKKVFSSNCDFFCKKCFTK